MRNVLLILLVFLSCASFYAQDKKEPKTDLTLLLKGNGVIVNDGCGDPMSESQLYTNRKGKITKIISANEVEFNQNSVDGNNDKKIFIVKLVGIDESQNEANIRNFLTKYVLNKSVEITGNLQNKSDKKFSGSIFLYNENADIDELNEYLLENGIAKFKSFNSGNLVPFYIPCRLQRAEESAKKEKLGIWAK